jgi:hypothetical protein
MPDVLYHGSPKKIDGPLAPILRHGSADHVHERAAVFATERLDIAALFMVPEGTLSSIGFEDDVAYICIWGTAEEFAARDPGGYVYVLPADGFERVGKDYERQSFTPVAPIEVRHFPSVVGGMLACGAQIYFVHDDPTMDRIVADKHHRAPILAGLVSENARQGVNVRTFSTS